MPHTHTYIYIYGFSTCSILKNDEDAIEHDKMM